jgi:hypothetical protein
MCLTETYSRVRVGKNLYDIFPKKKWVETGKRSIVIAFNLALEHAIRRVQVSQNGLKLNGTHQLLVYADYVNILGGSCKGKRRSFGDG